MTEAPAKADILIVDDEAPLRYTYARILERAGYRVCQAANGVEAIAALAAAQFDAIVSDISMPELNGIEMLRLVRERDLDVPVILNTGNPTVETAAQAVDYGALRYLVKPVSAAALLEAVHCAVKLRRLARIKREAAIYLGLTDRQVGDRAGLEVTFNRALRTLSMAYQPIVSLARQHTIAFEALVRTAEPALPDPGALFRAAERLNRVRDLSRAARHSVAVTMRDRAANADDIYVNVRPLDLDDDDLLADDSALAPFAKRVVLEITECSPLDGVADVPDRIRRLKQMGYRIAIDDLGAGYAGLNYFAMLTPDVVKLDMALVRNIAAEPVKQKLVGSMAQLCQDLGIDVIAEGVETAAERDIVGSLGCDLMQGYLFARPGPAFPDTRWDEA